MAYLDIFRVKMETEAEWCTNAELDVEASYCPIIDPAADEAPSLRLQILGPGRDKDHLSRFQASEDRNRASTKVNGLEIAELIIKIKEKVSLDAQQLQKQVEKLIHRNDVMIMWSELLAFLENEKDRSDVVNDSKFYGIGVKHLQDGDTHFLYLVLADQIIIISIW